MSTSLFLFRSPRLPPEVCDTIISFMDEDDYFHGEAHRRYPTRRGLYSCALVCRSWITRARIHLFRIVIIDNRSASGFVALVMAHPPLGSYVQRVELLGGYYSRRSGSTTSTTPVHNGWVYDFFIKVVPYLHNLTSIEFRQLPRLHRYLYTCHPPRVQSLTSLSLSHVDATSVGDVLRLISSYKCLKELYILRGEWGQFRNHHYYVGRRWSCNLRVLSIQRSTIGDILDLLHWLAQLRTSSFEHLFLQWGFSGKHPIGIERAPVQPTPDNIALGWTKTLKTLSLHFSENNDDTPYKAAILPKFLPIIKICSNLHTVRLETSNDKYGILQQLPNVLPALSSLHRFGLCINRFEQALEEERGELWEAVDRVFEDSTKLSQVEYFEVMWNYGNTHEKRGEGKTSTKADGESRSDRIDVYVYLLKGCCVDWHRKKPLTSIFPHLSARGILWFGLYMSGIIGVDSYYALQITGEISSPSWSPRYCKSLLDPNWHPDD